jgi:armadillo repeat-containing protein 8
MSSSVPGIRAAACQCTRSLSRSVCILRTNLVDAGIAVPLFRLLSDESLEVRIAATGAVCNLMLEFSPMRRAILEQGAMKILCQHTYSPYAQLRLNAVWALKHFCYQPDEPYQVEQMLHELGYDQLMRLCEDEDVGVQEQALSVIRNVMTGEVKSIGLLFDNIGSARLMKLIVEKLDSNYSELVAAVSVLLDNALILKAAYICVHIGSGTEIHRNALMSDPQVLRAILHHMDSPSDNVRIGCVWTIINLIVTEETFDARCTSPRFHQMLTSLAECRKRAMALRDLGVFDKLVRMKENDSSLDVKERAKSALAHLEGLNI